MDPLTFALIAIGLFRGMWRLIRGAEEQERIEEVGDIEEDIAEEATEIQTLREEALGEEAEFAIGTSVARRGAAGVTAEGSALMKTAKIASDYDRAQEILASQGDIQQYQHQLQKLGREYESQFAQQQMWLDIGSTILETGGDIYGLGYQRGKTKIPGRYTSPYQTGYPGGQ